MGFDDIALWEYHKHFAKIVIEKIYERVHA